MGKGAGERSRKGERRRRSRQCRCTLRDGFLRRRGALAVARQNVVEHRLDGGGAGVVRSQCSGMRGGGCLRRGDGAGGVEGDRARGSLRGVAAAAAL